MAVEQPKKPVGGAYGIFMAENRPEFAKACAGQSVAAVSKMAAAQWQALSAAKKKPYEKKYVAAKQKHAKDFAAFIKAGGVKSKGLAAQRSEKRKARERRAKKDPNRPKKPAGGAFACFVADKRSKFAKACAGQPAVAVIKMASAQWQVLSAAQKAPYGKVYQKKLKAYKEAMAAYVPPAGVEVDSQENGNDEDDAEHAEDEEEVAASPPAKVLKRTGKPAATVSAGDEAVFSGLDPGTKAKLKTLTSNPKIMAKGLGASGVLATLKEHGGKVVAAKHAMLGA